ncbi:hypothetical protein ACFFMN_41750 [Planobispora siamensis]|uniref:Uncharacterized protein n=1 Tax=Planobispora siamensis TaxID=936338 RepID=A0A8J3SNS6_9ACTN|nr:hypothetical protein [Planobispora siamensis]GIH95920.1 hypothetical protein Psi01_65500 [Planobispora siamensis]
MEVRHPHAERLVFDHVSLDHLRQTNLHATNMPPMLQQLYQRLAGTLAEVLNDVRLSEQDDQFAGVLARNLARDARGGLVPSLKSVNHIIDLRNFGSEARNAILALHKKALLEDGKTAEGNSPASSPRKATPAGAPAKTIAQIDDDKEYPLKPKPLTANTPAELVDLMRQLRIWSGEPSLRELARRSCGGFAPSTLCETLKKDRLPPYELLIAFVRACGGSEQDVMAWSSAWRRIRMAQICPRDAPRQLRPI